MERLRPKEASWRFDSPEVKRLFVRAAAAGVVLSVLVLILVILLGPPIRKAPEQPLPVAPTPPAAPAVPPAPIVVEKVVEKIVEVSKPSPLDGLDVYVRVEYAVADKFLRTLDDFSGPGGYTKAFLDDRPLFFVSSYADKPFFLWRRDFYFMHRDALQK